MNLPIPKRGDLFWIGPTFFLLAAAPGFWIPVISNVLTERGWAEYIPWAFLIPPLAGMISPLFLGARADQKIAANKLMVILVASGSIWMSLAFAALEKGESVGLFLTFLGINALVTGPSWALLTMVTLSNVGDPEREFGKYRVWGTLGWMCAGLLLSLLSMDASVSVGRLAIVAKVLGAGCCLMLPHTPPRGGPAKSIGDLFGLAAIRLFKERDLAVFFTTTFLFTMPVSAFYMHTPLHLRALGWESIGAGLSIGQMTEAVAMLVMGWFLTKWRIKWVLTTAIVGGVLRYLFFSLGDRMDSVWIVLVGIGFHGICWTYYFEAGKVFLQKRVEASVRAQTQALMGLLTGGIGSAAGILSVGWLYGALVDPSTGEGWGLYWLILAGVCVLCLAIFTIGYKGEPYPPADQS